MTYSLSWEGRGGRGGGTGEADGASVSGQIFLIISLVLLYVSLGSSLGGLSSLKSVCKTCEIFWRYKIATAMAATSATPPRTLQTMTTTDVPRAGAQGQKARARLESSPLSKPDVPATRKKNMEPHFIEISVSMGSPTEPRHHSSTLGDTTVLTLVLLEYQMP